MALDRTAAPAARGHDRRGVPLGAGARLLERPRRPAAPPAGPPSTSPTPSPIPAPVTTIAWRLAHLVVGVFGARNAAHFGGPPADYETWTYAATAAGALAQLDEGYRRWVEGVRGLGEDGLAGLCGPAEGPWADAPLAALVIHIHREVIHHGAEIALLRDLYAHRTDRKAL